MYPPKPAGSGPGMLDDDGDGGIPFNEFANDLLQSDRHIRLATPCPGSENVIHPFNKTNKTSIGKE